MPCTKCDSFFYSHVLLSADTGLLCSNILVMCCCSSQHPRKTYRS